MLGFFYILSSLRGGYLVIARRLSRHCEEVRRSNLSISVKIASFLAMTLYVAMSLFLAMTLFLPISK